MTWTAHRSTSKQKAVLGRSVPKNNPKHITGINTGILTGIITSFTTGIISVLLLQL